MWKTFLGEVSKTVFMEMAQVAVALLLVIILLIAGLCLSHIIKVVAIRALKGLRFDEIFSRTPLARVLEKSGMRYSLSETMGTLCYWIGLLVSLGVILNATGLTIAAELINKIILYIPNAIVAVAILILGILGASILNSLITTIALNSGIKNARILGRAAETAIIIFVSIMALEQLKIKVMILETTVGIILASAGLAFAIALGLGCKDVAGKAIIRLIEKISRPT